MLAAAEGAAEGNVACRLHTSGMARAMETAAIIGAALPKEASGGGGWGLRPKRPVRRVRAAVNSC
jgi:broad specificity phosphatase PhoE